jgi:hypothetical protein
MTDVSQWITFTPDGRRLVVSRLRHGWGVVCGEGDGLQHELLDVALIEAIRADGDFAGHSMRIDYGAWTRELADRLQREDECERANQLGD